jgi:hypothetical protein
VLGRHENVSFETDDGLTLPRPVPWQPDVDAAVECVKSRSEVDDAAGEDVGSEYQLNRIWAEPARGGVQLWELPDGKHTGALDEEPEEYERRVIGFFDRRVLGRS